MVKNLTDGELRPRTTVERAVKIKTFGEQKIPYTWHTDWRQILPKPGQDGLYHGSKVELNAFKFGGKLVKNLK